jgi:hypothetical protein
MLVWQENVKIRERDFVELLLQTNMYMSKSKQSKESKQLLETFTNL